ncbi:hypothetical protein ILUMI_14631 [Ignelater luminosus]|uniref:Uncharacterized protein n=1 Tax=Ignelater luminosus TaxID=2038154 RepID=A0A8K0CUF3_IGNLU|nr:hypothetical protein ILUMI_14631 [Ignelater luminosus]
MKSLIVLVPLLAIALTAPQHSNLSDADATISRYENNLEADGYNFAFETSNGISREETATIKNIGTDDEAIEIRGNYSYIDVNGKKVTVTFVADENGYRPKTVISSK